MSHSIAISKLLQQGRQHHEANQLAQAEQCYRKIIKDNPQHHEALHLMGLVAHQSGRAKQAIEYLTQALQYQAKNEHYLNNLGEAYRMDGQIQNAYDHYQKTLQVNPNHAEAHYNLGKLFFQQAKNDLSEQHFRKALIYRPDYLQAHLLIAQLLMRQNRLSQAAGHLRCVAALQPNNLQAQMLLADLSQRNNNLQEAVSHYSKALKIAPENEIALLNRANIYKGLGKLDDAMHGFREAIRIKPDYALGHLNLAICLKDQDKSLPALASFSRALELDPSLYKARLGSCISQIPVLYNSMDDIEVSRRAYSDALDELIDQTVLHSAQQINIASAAVGGLQPFYLAYQGQVDLDLQTRYGSLINRIQAARYPEFCQALSMPAVVDGEPLRVGFLSGYFNSHSNWKIPIKGWVENMDHQQFELFAYHVSQKHDQETPIASAAFQHFFHQARNTQQWAELILSHRLHVLIIPETGMDPATIALAALRLAPVQCTSWGHPQTSGLSTVDYFLSSDLMEPEGAEAHYSESLVRLPNLSIHYTPVEVTPAPVTRSNMGLREQGTLYFCAQSLFKYLPQYDDIFVNIASKVKDAQFLFLAYAPSDELTDRFKQRLLRAFAQQGLNGEHFICILPNQDRPHFHALNKLADVFLDSIGWSGCNSTLEAIAHDLPIVSYPGELMRGRHSLAIMKMMGMQQYVASSLEQYIEQAVRMAQDLHYRKTMSENIRVHKHKLYYDLEPVRALEDFIKTQVTSANIKH